MEQQKGITILFFLISNTFVFVKIPCVLLEKATGTEQVSGLVDHSVQMLTRG